MLFVLLVIFALFVFVLLLVAGLAVCMSMMVMFAIRCFRSLGVTMLCMAKCPSRAVIVVVALRFRRGMPMAFKCPGPRTLRHESAGRQRFAPLGH